MLCFAVNPPKAEQPAAKINLAGAYVVGSDGVPLRAEVELRNKNLICIKRAEGPAALAILWPSVGDGSLLIETSRLIDRETPYDLTLELARGRLMRINLKREEWGLYDFDGIEPIAAEIDKARDLFVNALKLAPSEERTKVAEQALQIAFAAGEKLTQFHAELFLTRRRQAHAFNKRTFGCTIDLANTSEEYRQRIRDVCDFVYLPVPWRTLEPKQQEFHWRTFDAWVEWLAKSRIPIKVGPLVSFNEQHIPDWLGIYETDFDTVRNLIFEHVRRIVERYGNYVHHWDVTSGVHAENTLDFTFEQVMELTRVTGSLVKQLAPRAQTVINLVAPWGEYYARNQRTIPPLLYADMVVQSGIAFDALGVQFIFGAPIDGMYVRDMFQISEKLDRLGNFGKPLHITALQVPSAPVGDGAAAGGKTWSETVQARWIKEFLTIALSKPFVESITWHELADRPQSKIPSGGLLGADLKPKPAFKVVKDFRNAMLNIMRKPPAKA